MIKNSKSIYLIKLNKIFRKILKEKNLNLKYSTNTKDIRKWDSLNHVKIILECEKQFKVKFKNKDINKINNVDKIINLLIKMN